MRREEPRITETGVLLGVGGQEEEWIKPCGCAKNAVGTYYCGQHAPKMPKRGTAIVVSGMKYFQANVVMRQYGKYAWEVGPDWQATEREVCHMFDMWLAEAHVERLYAVNFGRRILHAQDRSDYCFIEVLFEKNEPATGGGE